VNNKPKAAISAPAQRIINITWKKPFIIKRLFLHLFILIEPFPYYLFTKRITARPMAGRLLCALLPAIRYTWLALCYGNKGFFCI
jgi:hypothetical protein